MKSAITTMLNILRELYHKLCWSKECKQILQNTESGVKASRFEDGTSFLIVLPHADDEWIGCCNLIRSSKYKVELCNADMKGGDTPKNHRARRAETQNLANTYNRPITILNDNKAETLRKKLEATKPDIVFIPYVIDWHPEHIEVIRILIQALDNMQIDWDLSVGMYQVTIPICQENVSHICPASYSEWINKWIIFRRIYATQSHFPWFRVSRNELIQGKRFSCETCEVYCLMNYKSWKNKITNYIPTKEIQQDMQLALPSIKNLFSIKQPRLL